MPGRDEFCGRRRGALGRFVNGDAGRCGQLWSRAGDVRIFGGWGRVRARRDAVGGRLDGAASRFGEGHAGIGDLAAGSGGDLGYPAGMETDAGLPGGAPRGETALRVTHIGRRAGGGSCIAALTASGRARTRHRGGERTGWRLSPGSGPATTVIVVTRLPRRRRRPRRCFRAGEDAGWQAGPLRGTGYRESFVPDRARAG